MYFNIVNLVPAPVLFPPRKENETKYWIHSNISPVDVTKTLNSSANCKFSIAKHY